MGFWNVVETSLAGDFLQTGIFHYVLCKLACGSYAGFGPIFAIEPSYKEIMY